MTNLDEVIGKCRECASDLGNTPPPYCTDCAGKEARRATHVRESNPYKKVWNSVEDEESSLVEAAANNTLFCPTAGELALRSMGTARYFLAQARKFGKNNPEHGRELFTEAMIHVRSARKFWEEHNTILERSR